MKLIAATVRTTSLERVVQSLEHMGIKSMSISEIKGLGEEVRLNNPYSIHDKIELIVSDAQADAVIGAILENGRTGLAGDGIISVAPLDYAVKIRTKERLDR
jgi:nitrogen regulatory protein P-II 1